LTEDNQYDEIFTALNDPVRRQILLLIDDKGEASFAEILREIGITDTDLLSNHLKTLALLVEQPKQGSYRLSKAGKVGVDVFRKVNRERENTNKAIHKEVEHFVGLSIKKSVLFVLISGLTLFAPLLIDTYFSVSIVLNHGYSTFALIMVFLVTTAIMIMGIFLFTLYDSHYYSKTLKNNLLHSAVFALFCSVMSILFFFQLRTFMLSAGAVQLYGTEIPLIFEVLRVAVFIASTTAFVYLMDKSSKKEDKPKRMA
jgi:DNA-binding transcriptional ArsR family regulator